MNVKFDYVAEKRSPVNFGEKGYVKPEDWDLDIVETAGFVPLEVRFKQMEQAGYRARFFESEFSSKDVSDMFLNHPEFDITADDDYEDVMEKTLLRQEYINQIKKEIQARNAATDTKKSESEAKANGSESAAKEGKEDD